MDDNVLKVVIWGLEAGRLYWNKERRKALFTYDMDFLHRQLDLSPLSASIYSPASQKGLSHPGNTEKLYAGLPEFIADSLPDRWGNTIFQRWAASQNIPMRKLTPVDRLAYMGKRSMGALEFQPAYDHDDLSVSIQLSSLYRFADQIFNERQELSIPIGDAIHLESLYKVGTSAGGMRPKAIIAIDEKTGDVRSGQADLPSNYTHYIIKFDEGRDFPFTKVEKAYYDMAVASGIQMMSSKLVEIDDRFHFLTQRFDREDGRKVHTQTLAAMNSLADSYEDLFIVCRKLRLPADEISEQYRRMVFNVLAGNVDDHTKNFSFVMREDGVWHLSPAYDMTFSVDLNAPAYVNRHSMTICGKDHDITIKDMLDFAKINSIKNAADIIDQVVTSVSRFSDYAVLSMIEDKWVSAISQVITNKQ